MERLELTGFRPAFRITAIFHCFIPFFLGRLEPQRDIGKPIALEFKPYNHKTYRESIQGRVVAVGPEAPIYAVVDSSLGFKTFFMPNPLVE